MTDGLTDDEFPDDVGGFDPDAVIDADWRPNPHNRTRFHMQIRHIGTVRETATYKVTDDKVENGEAVVIAVADRQGDNIAVNCLTCNAYKCAHAAAVAKHIEESGS